MKLWQLPLGARFRYRGQILVKTGPLAAASESGGPVLIPRHAVLTPLDGVSPPPPPGPVRALDPAAVIAAFERFYTCASRVADEAGRRELTAARQEFWRELDVSSEPPLPPTAAPPEGGKETRGVPPFPGTRQR